jgi:hypothetical protein
VQLPGETSSFVVRSRYGRYVARRLRRAGHEGLAKDADKATRAVKAAGRAWEDSDEPVQDALADRDSADDDLDSVAQEARNALGGRGVGADKKEPYTLLFGEGIGYYIAAPLDEEERRYEELSARATEHLPANDPIRKAIAKGVKEGLTAFRKAQKDLENARTASALAATELARATERWQRQMEKTYGALIAEVGKPAAERFFPRTTTPKKKPAPAEPTAA